MKSFNNVIFRENVNWWLVYVIVNVKLERYNDVVDSEGDYKHDEVEIKK